jgi:hypothetical protein
MGPGIEEVLGGLSSRKLGHTSIASTSNPPNRSTNHALQSPNAKPTSPSFTLALDQPVPADSPHLTYSPSVTYLAHHFHSGTSPLITAGKKTASSEFILPVHTYQTHEAPLLGLKAAACSWPGIDECSLYLKPKSASSGLDRWMTSSALKYLHPSQLQVQVLCGPVLG